MRTIIIYNDTLRRMNLKTYNEKTKTITPNIDSFEKESVVFDNHYCGSMPCIPARRDLYTGRLNFLERSWGPIEITDTTFPEVLSKNNIKSHIITDHAHYFRPGGENYCQQFSTYEFFRGQESDPWVSLIDDPYMPKDYFGVVKRQYQCNRTRIVKESDFSSVKCFDSAIDWLDHNKGNDDFVLMIETFDPHEPFNVPQKYLDMYNDNYTGPHFDLPKYSIRDKETDDAIKHLRNQYMALITMIDKHFGELIKKLKSENMYEDTMIILTTDHGYCLGERDFFGKCYMPYYNELVNIPLMIHMPANKYAGTKRSQLTQNIDIMPTLLEMYNIDIPKTVMGKSLLPVIEEDKKIKDYALFGAFGLSVNIFDGKYVYMRGVRNNNLFEYTTSPSTIRGWIGQEIPKEYKCGRYLKWTDFPVFKIPSRFNPICNDTKYLKEDMLFDNINDYEQLNNIKDTRIRKLMIEKLVKAMIENQAPKEQFNRLGLD